MKEGVCAVFVNEKKETFYISYIYIFLREIERKVLYLMPKNFLTEFRVIEPNL